MTTAPDQLMTPKASSMTRTICWPIWRRGKGSRKSQKKKLPYIETADLAAMVEGILTAVKLKERT